MSVPAPPEEPSARDRILAAAVVEFAAAGRAGTRVEAIARRAGCNKQLLYHYFGNKDGLYEAVTMAAVAQKPPPGLSSPEDIGRAIDHILDHHGEMRDWWRLTLWEALETGEGPLVGEEQRRQKMNQNVADVENAQRLGLLDPALPARHVLLALMGMLVLPFVLPQLVRLVFGTAPSDPAFRQQYREVLLDVVARLQPRR